MQQRLEHYKIFPTTPEELKGPDGVDWAPLPGFHKPAPKDIPVPVIGIDEIESHLSKTPIIDYTANKQVYEQGRVCMYDIIAALDSGSFTDQFEVESQLKKCNKAHKFMKDKQGRQSEILKGIGVFGKKEQIVGRFEPYVRGLLTAATAKDFVCELGDMPLGCDRILVGIRKWGKDGLGYDKDDYDIDDEEENNYEQFQITKAVRTMVYSNKDDDFNAVLFRLISKFMIRQRCGYSDVLQYTLGIDPRVSLDDLSDAGLFKLFEESAESYLEHTGVCHGRLFTRVTNTRDFWYALKVDQNCLSEQDWVTWLKPHRCVTFFWYLRIFGFF